ncbi:hypothetical protein COO60DRAFT_554392 [Scenedesmus sp. NREL 46B-D3]|nr:hypothetical protein COO60DRAFT_554392 [Scenedesmus sp. NREL 46B-D3]
MSDKDAPDAACSPLHPLAHIILTTKAVVSPRQGLGDLIRPPTPVAQLLRGRETIMKLAILMFVAAIATVSGQMSMQMGDNIAMNGSRPIPDACVAQPDLANCTSYEYPMENAAADLKSLCTAMPFMAGCSVAAACNASGAGPSSPTAPGAANVSAQDPNICSPLNHVATICRLDTGMSQMKGCTNFNSMCAEGSRVAQCADVTGIAVLPPTRVINDQLRAVCEAMPHSGCELCLPSWQKNATWGDCDLLKVYGSVCGEMPDMSECEEWDAMCTSDPTLFACSTHPAAMDGRPAAAGNTTAAAAAAARSGAVTAAVQLVFVLALCVFASALLV